jgi:GNAT superfamily N-acetyltransferase
VIEIPLSELFRPVKVDYALGLPPEARVLIGFDGSETQFPAVLFQLRERFAGLQFVLRSQQAEIVERFVQRVPFWVLQRLHFSPTKSGNEAERLRQFLREKGAPAEDLEDVEILPISESEIMEIWRTQLWSERREPIRAMSSMTFPEGHDLRIYHRYQPSFFAALRAGRWVGVLGGHRTSAQHYRSRGLFVSPEARGRGLAQRLLSELERQAEAEGCLLLWSYPKLSALEVYRRFGFCPESPTSDTHVYVSKPIDRGASGE